MRPFSACTFPANSVRKASPVLVLLSFLAPCPSSLHFAPACTPVLSIRSSIPHSVIHLACSGSSPVSKPSPSSKYSAYRLNTQLLSLQLPVKPQLLHIQSHLTVLSLYHHTRRIAHPQLPSLAPRASKSKAPAPPYHASTMTAAAHITNSSAAHSMTNWPYPVHLLSPTATETV